MTTYDFVIIGAGIMGLTMARELCAKHPHASMLVLEKESQLGLHASGRNSGVLHSGIYYPENSLKAKFCHEGARSLKAYCEERGLPIHHTGKLILPTKASDASTLEMLYQRARKNGAQVSYIQDDELRQREPAAFSATGTALFVPETAVIDPKQVLDSVFQELQKKQVHFFFNTPCFNINSQKKTVQAATNTISYGHLINAAGLYADVIAQRCGVGDHLAMIPFKGFYHELSPTSSIKLNHLLYPVPDLQVPFLGIHFTKSVTGKVYIGPTAIPALGREHYKGLHGINWREAGETLWHISQTYIKNQQGFRHYAHQEPWRFIKKHFVACARALVPQLTSEEVVKSNKVGIRAQLYDKRKKELIMDFMLEKTAHETHILNAVSPGFTSAFSFAAWVVNNEERL